MVALRLFINGASGHRFIHYIDRFLDHIGHFILQISALNYLILRFNLYIAEFNDHYTQFNIIKIHKKKHALTTPAHASFILFSTFELPRR